MSGLIKGVHHIALKCKGLEQYEETIRFYRDILGMEVIRTWGEGEKAGIMISTGDALLEIGANADEQLGIGTIRHIALLTDSVDACVEAVTKAGYEITIGPKDIAFQSQPVYPARIAFCIGPVGEEVEFFEER